MAAPATSCTREDSTRLEIPRRQGTITIDGKIEEPAWSQAAATVHLRRFDGRAEPRQSTEAFLCWDDRALYVAFRCADRDIHTSYTRRDQPLYLQEAVELFLDPDGNKKDYMEIEASPAGVLFDATFSGRRQGMDLGFDPPIRVAARVDGTLNRRGDRDRAWTVELAIPYAGMVGRARLPPRAGDCWRLNLFRLDKTEGTQEASSLGPTRGDFHDLGAFVTACFTD